METRTTRFTRLGRALAVVLYLVTGLTGDLGGAMVANSNRGAERDATEQVVKGPR